MNNSNMLTIMAIPALFLVLACCAHAACSSCAKEADWSETAKAFISGTPMSEEPIAFGPKAARAETSQFEKRTESAPETAENSGEGDSNKIALQSINATPASVNSTATTRIAAVFAINSSENVDQGEMQLSANGVIKDSAGREVAKLTLIKQSDSQYTGNWTADVPPGIYSMDIAASSIFGAASFKDAMQIEVLGG